MNERLEKLIYRVLEENDNFTCDDSRIKQPFKQADKTQKLQIIKKEYSKTIEIDDLSLLAGRYPTFSFEEIEEEVVIEEEPEIEE